MNKDLDKFLCAQYPKLFAQRMHRPRDTAMCWGFECGDGWFNVIDNLCKEIQEYLDNNPHIEQIHAVQVKEKYGGLRFYLDFSTEEIDKMIRKAEVEASKTCDVCGKPGELGGSGWYATRCEEHTKA